MAKAKNRLNYHKKLPDEQKVLLIDITMPLRLYTHQAQLVLHTSERKNLFGFSRSKQLNQIDDN